MSFQAMSWAQKVVTGSPSVKAVLMAISNYADEDGVCWPSQEMLASDTELSRHTVMRCMDSLEQMGIISRQRQHRNDGSRKSDRITLDLSSTVQRSNIQRSTVEEPKSHHATAEPITEPITSTLPARDDETEAYQAFRDVSSDLRLPTPQDLTPDRRAKLKARLVECGGLGGWFVAMSKIRESQFLRGEISDFRCTFDFILQKSSFRRLMEGNYDDRPRTGKASKPTDREGWDMVDAVLAEGKRRENGSREAVSEGYPLPLP